MSIKQFLADNLEFKGISGSILGVNINLGPKTNIKYAEKKNYLKELYKMRNSVSRYYFSYHSIRNDLSFRYDDVEELENEISLKYLSNTLSEYRDIADILIGSEYFLLLENEERKKILDSFDYIYSIDTGWQYVEEFEIPLDEIHEVIADLLYLYENIDQKINELVEK